MLHALQGVGLPGEDSLAVPPQKQGNSKASFTLGSKGPIGLEGYSKS